jgi:hypothetical protein
MLNTTRNTESHPNDQLSFSDRHWSIFHDFSNAKATVHRFIVPFCAITLPDETSPGLPAQNKPEPPRVSAPEFTRIKTAALLTLTSMFFPSGPVEMLIGDSLSLDNHPQGNTETSQQDIQERKNKLSTQLRIPFNQLSAQQPTVQFTYTPPTVAEFSPYFPKIEPVKSKECTLVSIDKYTSPEVKAFMERIRGTLNQIAQMPNALDILLDDTLLFSENYLGYAKSPLEERLTVDLKADPKRAEIAYFINSLMLSALHYLKNRYGVKSPLNDNFKSAEFTQGKKNLFAAFANKVSLDELLTSFTYIIQEFCVFHDMLVRIPRSEKVPDAHLIICVYPMKNTAPAFHALVTLDITLERRLATRRFLALSEFQLSNNNRSVPSSITGDPVMYKPTQSFTSTNLPPKRKTSFGSFLLSAQALQQNGSTEVSPTPSSQSSNGSTASSSTNDEHDQTPPTVDKTFITQQIAEWLRRNGNKPGAVNAALNMALAIESNETSPSPTNTNAIPVATKKTSASAPNPAPASTATTTSMVINSSLYSNGTKAMASSAASTMTISSNLIELSPIIEAKQPTCNLSSSPF